MFPDWEICKTIMNRIGIIGIENAWSSTHLANTIEKKTGFRLLIEMDKVFYDSDKKTAIYYANNNEYDLKELDALIIKKISKEYNANLAARLNILQYMHDSGVVCFSEPKNIFACYDRLANTMILQKNNIPMPLTTITESVEHAEKVVDTYKEVVFKPLYSTKARGMMLLNAKDPQKKEKIIEFAENNPILYIQKKIDTLEFDLGISFLGGKYIGTYSRVKNGNSWNTTIHEGGKYKPYEPDNKIIEMAHKAQSGFELDFTCVDVAITANGPLVFEVSAFGGFKGLKEANNFDAAQPYLQYVLEVINNKNIK